MVERAKALQMPAMALTDHGNMFGRCSSTRRARTQGAPVLGCG